MCVCSSVGFAAGQTDNNRTLCSTERCKTKYFICASVAQLDRASDSDSEGRWFDSSQAHQKTPQKILRSFCFISLLFRKRRFGLWPRRVGADNLGGCQAGRTKKTGQTHIFFKKKQILFGRKAKHRRQPWWLSRWFNAAEG